MTFIDVYRKSIELIESNTPFVLATVVRSLGSTPQKVGANAIFEVNGQVHGTLGGGCLEAEARKRAMDALDDGQSSLFHLKLDDISGWDDGLICGGQATILIQPLPSMNISAYRVLIEAEKEGRAGKLLTKIIRSDGVQTDSLWLEDGDALEDSWFSDPEVLKEVKSEEQAELKGDFSKADQELLFIEPCVSKPELLIAGAGHVGKAVASLGGLMGFRTVVVDDRPEFACAGNLPGVDQVICGNIPQTISEWDIKENTYILIVTRGHQHDGASLAACVKSSAKYIGMIGSRRKSMLIRNSLKEKGLATSLELERVVCPVGLDIGSVSVQEIALSIVSQLVAFRRKGKLDASSMTYSKS